MVDDIYARLRSLLADLADLLAGLAIPCPFEADGHSIAPGSAGAQRPLPVLDWLDATARQAPARSEPIARQVAALGGALAWRQTYSRDEIGDDFLQRYGWTELVGAKGLVRNPAVSAGLLLLGPDVHYPAHHHPALEHYVPLSGTAQWYDEDLGWRAVAPLRTIVHRPNVRHAIRTGEAPLLAYFHWSGAGVDDRARLSGDAP